MPRLKNPLLQAAHLTPFSGGRAEGKSDSEDHSSCGGEGQPLKFRL